VDNTEFQVGNKVIAINEINSDYGRVPSANNSLLAFPFDSLSP